jgi:hypothetical protein
MASDQWKCWLLLFRILASLGCIPFGDEVLAWSPGRSVATTLISQFVTAVPSTTLMRCAAQRC